MKVFRPSRNTYIILKNGLPYEVTKENESKLHLELENVRISNPNDFEIDLQEELPSIEIPISEEQQRLLDLEVAMAAILGGGL